MDLSTASVISRVLLTGLPGNGKTTICKNISSILERENRNFDGFYTEEVRAKNGSKIGYDVIPVKDIEKRIPLARTENILSGWEFSNYRVGNYHVFINNFENSVLPVLKTEADILLIDEIGRKELYSTKFHSQVNDIFFGEPLGNKKTYIIATIPIMSKAPQRHLTLFQKFHNDDKCKIIRVNRQNRDSLPYEIVSMIP